MCIKNQDVGRMLKGIRQIENDDMAAMETHQLAEVIVRVVLHRAGDGAKLLRGQKSKAVPRVPQVFQLTGRATVGGRWRVRSSPAQSSE